MQQETIICKLCLEPIFNFICIDCQYKSISKWLKSLGKNNLLNEFEKLHKKIDERFASPQNSMFCIKCKKVVETTICPYCYAKEVFWWLFRNNIILAKKFARLFNFDFLGVGYLPTIKTRNLEPVIIIDKRRNPDLNFCENCGQALDLIYKNGRWLCKSCADDFN
jgi:hypothetical protein